MYFVWTCKPYRPSVPGIEIASEHFSSLLINGWNTSHGGLHSEKLLLPDASEWEGGLVVVLVGFV